MANGDARISIEVVDHASPKLWEAYKALVGINARARRRDAAVVDCITRALSQRPDPTDSED
jgi:hypothetical protein